MTLLLIIIEHSYESLTDCGTHCVIYRTSLLNCIELNYAELGCIHHEFTMNTLYVQLTFPYGKVNWTLNTIIEINNLYITACHVPIASIIPCEIMFPYSARSKEREVVQPSHVLYIH